LVDDCETSKGVEAVNTNENSIRVLLIEDNPGDVRLIREMLQAAGGFGGRRSFGYMNPFGLTNGLAVLALIIAIVGLAWLGLAIRKSHETTAK
jgi:hypothetical protein